MATAFLISAGSSWESSCSRIWISSRSCFLMCSGIHCPWREAGLLHPQEVKYPYFSLSLYAGDGEPAPGRGRVARPTPSFRFQAQISGAPSRPHLLAAWAGNHEPKLSRVPCSPRSEEHTSELSHLGISY